MVSVKTVRVPNSADPSLLVKTTRAVSVALGSPVAAAIRAGNGNSAPAAGAALSSQFGTRSTRTLETMSLKLSLRRSALSAVSTSSGPFCPGPSPYRVTLKHLLTLIELATSFPSANGPAFMPSTSAWLLPPKFVCSKIVAGASLLCAELLDARLSAIHAVKFLSVFMLAFSIFAGSLAGGGHRDETAAFRVARQREPRRARRRRGKFGHGQAETRKKSFARIIPDEKRNPGCQHRAGRVAHPAQRPGRTTSPARPETGSRQ
ncbi:MAG: hypothetical protein MUE46_03845 [Xanthomonadales bacterium]|nr:hypothetical protein [Xanthomonadales bacterium]